MTLPRGRSNPRRVPAPATSSMVLSLKMERYAVKPRAGRAAVPDAGASPNSARNVAPHPSRRKARTAPKRWRLPASSTRVKSHWEAARCYVQETTECGRSKTTRSPRKGSRRPVEPGAASCYRRHDLVGVVHESWRFQMRLWVPTWFRIRFAAHFSRELTV